MTNTLDKSTETLIEEAVERYKEFMTDVQINAYDHKTDKYDFSYIESSVKGFLEKELSTIASKSAENERLKLANFAVDHGYINSKEDVRLIWEELNETSK